MNTCHARRFTRRAALVLGLTLAFQLPYGRPAAQPARPVIYSAIVESIIHPVSAEYIAATLDRADAAGAALVVLTLRTPGGLVDSTRAIVSHMVAARTPVAVFVAPAGTRATSAGFILTIAADVAAMAPGTHIGAAHPVDGSGQKVDETMAAKMTEDLSAYARTLAGRRGRNVTLAAEAVGKSRAFTEEEARDATPPLIDLVAADLPELLRQLDGRTVTRFDGTSVVLHTAGAEVVDIEMTLRQRVLSTVANPTIAYLLMSLGTLAITIGCGTRARSCRVSSAVCACCWRSSPSRCCRSTSSACCCCCSGWCCWCSRSRSRASACSRSAGSSAWSSGR
ncbi:MAG: ATP-dependent Clp protease proteolytic subunit [Vicinamibacterales bacterium]